MRILFGVQGTGNGHLTRARAMAKAFSQIEHVEVDFLISGRRREALFDVEVLSDYMWREGLSFATRNGKVSVMDTVSLNPWWQFWRDVRNLDLGKYELVVTDFEPVSAWAAKRSGVPCIGIGRQYAFYDAHPSLPISSLQRAMVRQFAPVDLPLGTHWQPLTATTLPPIIEPVDAHQQLALEHHYLVYLPFESLNSIQHWLQELAVTAPRCHFVVFHPDAIAATTVNAQYLAPSRTAFGHAFAQAVGVITNAGFGTCSEALMAGKKLLVKPLMGQFEQVANANYLASQGLAETTTVLNCQVVEQWLTSDICSQLLWQSVAEPLARWLADTNRDSIENLAARLWAESTVLTPISRQLDLPRRRIDGHFKYASKRASKGISALAK